jgi:hypothetical protein
MTITILLFTAWMHVHPYTIGEYISICKRMPECRARVLQAFGQFEV